MKHWLIYSFVFYLFPILSSAQQIYTDLGVHLNTYSQTGPLNPDGGIPMPGLRLGVGFKDYNEGRFVLNVEGGFHRRAFSLKYPEKSFEVRSDIFTLGVMGDYRVSDYFFLESGLFPIITVTRLDPIPFFFGAFDNEMDEGYRYFDVEFALGGTIYPHEKIGIGARGRCGLLPMLKYREIGNYGEWEDPDNYMRAWTLELFLRILWQSRD